MAAIVGKEGDRWHATLSIQPPGAFQYLKEVLEGKTIRVTEVSAVGELIVRNEHFEVFTLVWEEIPREDPR